MNVLCRDLGRVDYTRCWQDMRAFTDSRETDTPDELWALEHPPVFTLGRAGKPEHVLAPGRIPVVRCDRGGQVTYHGPGQLVVYVLLDVKRLGLGPRELVRRLERGVIDYLASLALTGARRDGAPGVYVDGAKIAALGLRIRNGCCYHGLALNVAMDLAPYQCINPCGYAGLEVTQLSALAGVRKRITVMHDFLPMLAHSLYGGAEVRLEWTRSPHAQPARAAVRQV